MPPILLSPVIKWAAVALGGAMIVAWAVKEARRLNEEIERARRPVEIPPHRPFPTLRRDPRTGEYRP